jgi:hypothetical protein
MMSLVESLLSVEFMKFLISALGAVLAWLFAVLAWLFNERWRRAQEDYRRKEERYRELLISLKGFHVGVMDRQARQIFLDQIVLCWLYCPDSVIEKLYAFVDVVKTGANSTEQERNQRAGEVVAAIREDLLARRLVTRSSLKPEDFRILALPQTDGHAGTAG